MERSENVEFSDVGVIGTIEYGRGKRLLITEMEIVNHDLQKKFKRLKFSEQWYGGDPKGWNFSKGKSFMVPLDITKDIARFLAEYVAKEEQQEPPKPKQESPFIEYPEYPQETPQEEPPYEEITRRPSTSRPKKPSFL